MEIVERVDAAVGEPDVNAVCEPVAEMPKSHRCGLSCPVQHLLGKKPVVVTPNSSLKAVACILAAKDVGAAVVVGTDGPLGLVSERDVVKALAEGTDPYAPWALTNASTPLLFARPGATILEVIRHMSTEAIRQVPIKEGAKIVGIIDVEDILSVLDGELFD